MSSVVFVCLSAVSELLRSECSFDRRQEGSFQMWCNCPFKFTCNIRNNRKLKSTFQENRFYSSSTRKSGCLFFPLMSLVDWEGPQTQPTNHSSVTQPWGRDLCSGSPEDLLDTI